MQVDERVDERPQVDTGGVAFWKVGLALLALIVVLIGGAFLLNQRLRPRVGIEPAPTAVARTEVTPAPAKSAPGPASTPTATLPGGLRVRSSPLEREIEAAYLHYWDVLAQAYLDLDASHLTEVMAGDELRRTQEQIQQLKAQGRAARLDVVHQMAFVKVSPERAEIYDQYLNRSVFLDAATKEELKTSQPPTTEKLSFTLEKTGSTWKVVEGVRHD